jgi:hypothetical protein
MGVLGREAGGVPATLRREACRHRLHLRFGVLVRCIQSPQVRFLPKEKRKEKKKSALHNAWDKSC